MKACVLLAALLIFLSACAAPLPDEPGITVYNIKNENGFDRLTAQRQPVDADADSDELIAVAARALTSPGVQTGPNASAPPGVVPYNVGMSVSRSGSVVEIDFGEQMIRLSAARTSMIIAAAVLTLLEIEGVGYVYVTIGGEPAPPFYDRALTSSGFVTGELALSLLGR